MPISKVETKVSEQYNRLAPIYDIRWRKYIARSLSFLLDFVDISPQASVLDLGCGTGELTKLIVTFSLINSDESNEGF